MKVSLLVDGKTVSSKYRNAEKILTIDLDTNKKTEEKITASNGKDLASRINDLMPDALILGWAGPAIKHVDSKITVYEANAGDKIDDVLDLYNQGNLKEYDNPYPAHNCVCAGCTKCCPSKP